MRQRERRAANGSIPGFEPGQDRFANANALPTLSCGVGLVGSTRVNTPNGPVAIEDLTTGQDLVAADGTQTRLAHVLPVETSKTALRIRAPYFGLNQDIILGENQLLAIRSDVAEYMFNEACVFVPAWAFKDNAKVLHHELGKTDTMFQLQTADTQGFAIGECGFVGFHTDTTIAGGKILSDAEARAFVTERRIGQYN